MSSWISIYAAGADLAGSDIAERAKSIERSNRMLKLLESSVDLLRNNHKYGEQYYWILYYAFLSPQQLKNTEEVLEKLEQHIPNISYRTYYRKRHQAIEALSSILWGYTAKGDHRHPEQILPRVGSGSHGSGTGLSRFCDCRGNLPMLQ